jgi:Fe-S cluster assembly protein SufD
MSASTTAVRSEILQRVLHDYKAVADGLPGDAQAHAGRARAAGLLADLGWPSSRDEHWRYANLRAFERLSAYRPAPGPRGDAAATLAALHSSGTLPAPVPGFERMIFLDGIRIGAAQSLQPTAASAAEWLWPAELRFGLLCDMFASDAARLQVSGDERIEVLFITSPGAAGAAVYPRLHVELAPNSQLQLIERHLGAPATAALVACNVTIDIARAARLRHYRLQQCGPHTTFTDTLWARLAEQSHYSVCAMTFGAGTARTSARVQLSGRAAELDWQAISAGRGEQVQDTALRVEHAAAETRTDEMFRGIADERARLAFSGHIHIAATAPGSQARQSLRGLIEGAGAEIDLQPHLEINTDEVRASHGATTGRLDENLLFYLLARGIDRHSARGLLKWAFLSDVLREIAVPALRTQAERAAAGQLQDVPIMDGLT